MIKCTLSLVFATSLDLCRFISQSPLMWNCTPQIPAMEFLSSSSPLPSDFLPFIQPPLFFSSFFLISPPLGFFRSGVECFFFLSPSLVLILSDQNGMQIRESLILYKTSCFLRALVCGVAADHRGLCKLKHFYLNIQTWNWKKKKGWCQKKNDGSTFRNLDLCKNHTSNSW